MFDVAIYSKTAAGRAEISERSLGLPLRLRQALILVDGKTPYSELKPLLTQLGPPNELMTQLSELGLVVSDYDLPPMPEFPSIDAESATTSYEFHPTR